MTSAGMSDRVAMASASRMNPPSARSKRREAAHGEKWSGSQKRFFWWSVLASAARRSAWVAAATSDVHRAVVMRRPRRARSRCSAEGAPARNGARRTAVA
uniref:Uncharacterized protein n=1 Tax=Human herpesvirus 2 TaxID=10310 RepID=A0A481TX80_HHV2|nr:hypothetical protein [Human alphaherpesvirus 2]